MRPKSAPRMRSGMVRLEASMAAARLRLFVALALLLGACLLALAAPAGSAEDLGGLYVVVDGPKAGSFVEAKDDGTVNIGDNIRSGADGHLAAARGRCKSLHFRGEID